MKSHHYKLWGGLTGFTAAILFLATLVFSCRAVILSPDASSLGLCKIHSYTLLVILGNIFTGFTGTIQYFGFSPLWVWMPAIIVVTTTILGVFVGWICSKRTVLK